MGPLAVWVKAGTKVKNKLKSPLGILRVRVEESVFTIDRAVLGKNCEYFRALFRSGMKDSQLNEFHLQGGLKARGFLIAMAVSRGECPAIIDPDELVEAAECAAFLQVDVLVQHLIDLLDTDNCILLYHTAAVYGLWRLYHRAAVFIRDAYSDVQDALEALPEELICYMGVAFISIVCRSRDSFAIHEDSAGLLQDGVLPRWETGRLGNIWLIYQQLQHLYGRGSCCGEPTLYRWRSARS